MRYIIDRFEEGIAICENELKKMLPIPKEHLPQGAKEGDILTEDNGTYSIDPEATKERRREMRKKLMDLFE